MCIFLYFRQKLHYLHFFSYFRHSTSQFELPAAAAAVSCISETENSVQSAGCDTSEDNHEQNSADKEADISE